MRQHKSRRRRAAITVVLLFAGALTASCVDLFHSTDFDTLCKTDPSNPQCASEGGSDSPVTDAPVVDGARPHPDFCKWSHDEVYTQATKACARIGGCVGPLKSDSLLGNSQFGPCVVAAQLAFDCNANKLLRPAGESDAFWSCVATASNCSEISQCVYPKGVDTCGSDATAGTFQACGDQRGNANVRIGCLASKVQPAVAADPCVAFGQGCARLDMSSSACAGPQGASCTTPGCMGTSASDCVNGRDVGLDCASRSATCVEVSAGVPACKPTAPATACTDIPPTCTGDLVNACVGGKLVEIDCAQLGANGLPCDVTTPPPLYAIANACIDTSNTCKPADENCTSTVLSSCARGRVVTVECASAGFTGCSDADDPPHCTGPKATF